MVQRTEIYECRACGAEVTRPISRGQRPKWCPRCVNKRERTCLICLETKPMSGASCGPCHRAKRRAAWVTKQLVLFTGERLGPQRKAPLVQQGTRAWVAGPCAWCTQPFVIVDQLEARFCSIRCTRSWHRAKRGRFLIRPAVRLSIYERDGWVCQLCMQSVDRDGDPFGNWAPSLDHIECQSWALIPDHSPTNLRLAHRWCNAVRGDETGERLAFATM